MKCFNIVLVILLFPLGMMGQSTSLLDRFYGNMISSCVEMDMKYQIRLPGVTVDGSGLLEFQDELWHLNGNGIEMWCNGSTVWTIDPEAKEVVIDKVSAGEASELMVNPAVLLVNINDLFKLRETVPGKDGKSVIHILYPKTESFVSFVNLDILKADAFLRKTDFSLDDGTSVTVDVISMKLGKKKPAGYFSRPVTYDQSWIVTDMR